MQMLVLVMKMLISKHNQKGSSGFHRNTTLRQFSDNFINKRRNKWVAVALEVIELQTIEILNTRKIAYMPE